MHILSFPIPLSSFSHVLSFTPAIAFLYPPQYGHECLWSTWYSTGRLKKCGFSALNTTPSPTHSLSRLCLLEWLAIAHHSPVGFDALHLLERLNPTRDGSSEDNGFEYGYLSPEVPCLT